MKKKRLLIFHPTIAPYRIDFFNDLYDAFDSKVCLQYKNLKSQKFDYERISSQFAFTPMYLPGRSKWTLCNAVKKEIKCFQPDIVLTCEFNVITVFALLYRLVTKKRYKIIVMCDDSYDMVAEGNDFSVRHRVARNNLSHYIDDIIVVNSLVQKWFADIYNKGIYFPIIKNEEKARQKYREAIHLQHAIKKQYQIDQKNIFLFVGRLVPIKNVDSVIRAFASLDQDKNTLVVVGGGPEEKNLKSLAQEKAANVIFTGRLEGEALNVWYTLADCFVLASYQEPFGAVTNEALLAGCRCLISQKAGSSCLIEEGQNGFVFDPRNEMELTRKMKDTLLLPKVKMSDDGIRENQMRVNYKEMMRGLIADFYFAQ